MTDIDDAAVAVVGMAGRFPGAPDVDAFWRNLASGEESISRLSPEELAANGVPAALAEDPSYVPAKGVLAGADLFDAGFFGYSPREAAFIDPQQRVFLQTAWSAMENAGYDVDRIDWPVGVFAGGRMSQYAFNLVEGLADHTGLDDLALLLGNDKDYLASRVSYQLGLTGPSVAVHTACSSSLVAVALACQSLLTYQCDMALAGGVRVSLPLRAGYRHTEESICSPDGHCRAFDAEAAGTVWGDGVGAVVLKRLADALADGDSVHGLILGSAVNNDGAAKTGWTAPSVRGQAEVIARALAVSDVAASSLSYVEAHGTGTRLGDPLELAALHRAFAAEGGRPRPRSCGVGSVKPNIGHLSAAAGIAGLIKVLLSLRAGLLPPSINFKSPNPELELDRGPFFVNDSLREWESDGPRRAGVSSFGMGGTNCHVVVQEAPRP